MKLSLHLTLKTNDEYPKISVQSNNFKAYKPMYCLRSCTWAKHRFRLNPNWRRTCTNFSESLFFVKYLNFRVLATIHVIRSVITLSNKINIKKSSSFYHAITISNIPQFLWIAISRSYSQISLLQLSILSLKSLPNETTKVSLQLNPSPQNQTTATRYLVTSLHLKDL